MTRELLRRVRLLDPVSHTDRQADVLLEQGVVQAVEADLGDVSSEVAVRDCTGLVLGPGLVDLYSRSGEPGFEDRETLASLSAAALAGGFTRLTLLPNTQPAIDNPATVAWIRSRQQDEWPQLHCWGALTLETKGEQMVELAELAKAEIAGFTDGKPIANSALLRRILEYSQGLRRPIAIWCSDPALVGNGAVREGDESMRLGCPEFPALPKRPHWRLCWNALPKLAHPCI